MFKANVTINQTGSKPRLWIMGMKMERISNIMEKPPFKNFRIIWWLSQRFEFLLSTFSFSDFKKLRSEKHIRAKPFPGTSFGVGKIFTVYSLAFFIAALFAFLNKATRNLYTSFSLRNRQSSFLPVGKDCLDDLRVVKLLEFTVGGVAPPPRFAVDDNQFFLV